MVAVDLGDGRGWLEEPAAKSIARIDIFELGHPMQITEAGRSYAYQDGHYQRYVHYLNGGPWAPIALAPWTPSVHQKGGAIDSNEAQRHLEMMEWNGWRRTVYRNGKLVELWHFEYFLHLDNRRHQEIRLVNVGGTWRFAHNAPQHSSSGAVTPLPVAPPPPVPKKRKFDMYPLMIIEKQGDSNSFKLLMDPLEGTSRRIKRAENRHYRALAAKNLAVYTAVPADEFDEIDALPNPKQ